MEAPEFFVGGGIEGEKCISEGAKIQKKYLKNCRKWLIFAFFSSNGGVGGGGRASDKTGQ